MSKILSMCRAIWRVLGLAIYTMFWLLSYWITRIGTKNLLTRGIRWRRKWLNVMLPMLGVRIHISGREHLPVAPAIYASNHRSYMDPAVVATIADGVLVGKSEVAGWPLIGAAARIGGVIFVKREDKDSRSATLQKMEELLGKGYSILVCPEGTTTRAPEFLPFRPGAFRIAASLSVPVVPIAIEYADPDDAWIGDDTFVRHFFQTFRKRHVDVYLSIGAPLRDADAPVLMSTTHDWIAHELGVLRSLVQPAA